jgi:hypothetical protein
LTFTGETRKLRRLDSPYGVSVDSRQQDGRVMLLRTDVLRHLRRWASVLPLLVLLAGACSPDHYPQTALRPLSDFAKIGDDIQT